MFIFALLLERYRRRAAQCGPGGQLPKAIRLSRTMPAGGLSTLIADELNQPLASIMSNAEAAEILLSTNPPDTRQVKEILAEIRQADQRAADLIQQLRELLAQPAENELEDFDRNGAVAEELHILSSEARRRNIVSRPTGGTVFRSTLPLIKKPII